jgi:hypothetical protein
MPIILNSFSQPLVDGLYMCDVIASSECSKMFVSKGLIVRDDSKYNIIY